MYITRIYVVQVVHTAKSPLTTGINREPLLIFDVFGDAETDGLPFSRVPVLKIFLGVFPLIYGRK